MTGISLAVMNRYHTVFPLEYSINGNADLSVH